LPGGHVPGGGDVALAQDAGEVGDEFGSNGVVRQAVAEFRSCASSSLKTRTRLIIVHSHAGVLKE
jgi:hypothetical protein